MQQKLLFWIAFCLLSGLSKAQPDTTLVAFFGEAQGTTYNIKYRDSQQRNFKREVEILLSDIDRCVSNYRTDSEISVFNRSHSIRFQRPYFRDLLIQSKEIYIQTNGAFDPTVYPLVEAYGFGPDRKRNIPQNMDSLLNLVGFNHITFDSIAVAKAIENVRLDFNAIAKGYSVDKIADLLSSNNIHNYLIEMGGEIRCSGEKNTGQPWKVGIENPFDSKHFSGTIQIHNQGMATSGNYRNRYSVGGEVYNHIIDPKTGNYQASELFSATVLAPDAATADAYATAFMIMGLKDTQSLLQRHPELNAYLIYADKQGNIATYITEGIKKYVSLTSENNEN